ncbi:MAG: indole-3-glycerol-phosphate synthase, partial [Polyangiaceae bacterium]|nr:indole-3-glycerol-phosphate synthase [Polyangiaceae bacterium]
ARALAALPDDSGCGARAVEALTRPHGAPPRVIAEVKFRSPSAGVIRASAPGEGMRVAEGYVRGGASAVSVLADGPGFGGSPLGVRRVARAVDVPVLFKEFVIDEVQVDLARAMGASMVLLLVRILPRARLDALVEAVHARGMEPVVEAADAREVEVAAATKARIIGVNARDLRSFRVDTEAAARALEGIPAGRVAVFMSGIRTPTDLRAVAETRADAVLVGEGLMRHETPGERLREMLEAL